MADRRASTIDRASRQPAASAHTMRRRKVIQDGASETASHSPATNATFSRTQHRVAIRIDGRARLTCGSEPPQARVRPVSLHLNFRWFWIIRRPDTNWGAHHLDMPLVIVQSAVGIRSRRPLRVEGCGERLTCRKSRINFRRRSPGPRARSPKRPLRSTFWDEGMLSLTREVHVKPGNGSKEAQRKEL